MGDIVKMKLKECCGVEPSVVNCGVGEADMYLISCDYCNKSIMHNGDWEYAIKEWNEKKDNTSWTKDNKKDKE